SGWSATSRAAYVLESDAIAAPWLRLSTTQTSPVVSLRMLSRTLGYGNPLPLGRTTMLMELPRTATRRIRAVSRPGRDLLRRGEADRPSSGSAWRWALASRYTSSLAWEVNHKLGDDRTGGVTGRPGGSARPSASPEERPPTRCTSH